MKSLPVQKLAEIALIVPGRHLVEAQHNRSGKGIPYLTGPSDFGITIASATRWTDTPDVMCLPEDILVTVKGNGVGRTNYAPTEPACIGRQLMAVRAKSGESSPRYLFHALRHNFKRLADLAIGATVPGLSIHHLANLTLPTPQIEDQHRIAAELDEQLGAIDEARAAAERRVAAAEALEAALLREHFHGLTPVLIGLPKEAAPAGWKWTRLVELADLESGHTPSRKHPEWWGGDIPWIALPDIRALDGKVAMETKGYPTAEGIANSSARILPKDTVVFGRDVQVGFTTIMGRPMATSQHFFNWVCGKDLNPRFLMHALRASKTYMESMSSGAIHQTIYMPAAREFHLCHPARKSQESLAAALTTRLADAATLLSAARAELAAIQALPAAALRRVFS
jgi:type I restriction enzyme S subunit